MRSIFAILVALLFAVPTHAQCPIDGPWSPATHVEVRDPRAYGAQGNGTSDDTAAIAAAINALPSVGGVVRFTAGNYLKANKLLTITKPHVHLWAPQSDAVLLGAVRAKTSAEKANPAFCGPREQATIFKTVNGGGVHGLRFDSTAVERHSCGESNQIVFEGAQNLEVVGVEITGSAAAGVFAYRSTGQTATSGLKIVGNYIHHTRADSIHHTSGTRNSYVWANDIYNELPTRGDDGIACVTYGVNGAKCGQMEWWDNRYFGGANGRGMAIIGGEQINAHHNWVVSSSAAGILVGSEPGYNSATSTDIQLSSNWLVDSPDGTVNNGHAAILISGMNSAAPPVSNVASTGNVIVNPWAGRTERAEGSVSGVTFADLVGEQYLPSAPPQLSNASRRAVTTLRTWDTSFAGVAGVYRVHLRETPAGAFEERFEYVVKGSAPDIAAWFSSAPACGSRLLTWRTVGLQTYAVILMSNPVSLPASVSAVTFSELRDGDNAGTLNWLWSKLESSPDTVSSCAQ
jgi:hypothetical protein